MQHVLIIHEVEMQADVTAPDFIYLPEIERGVLQP